MERIKEMKKKADEETKKKIRKRDRNKQANRLANDQIASAEVRESLSEFINATSSSPGAS